MDESMATLFSDNNIVEAVLKLDKASRINNLIDNVKAKLDRIRSLKSSLELAQTELRELLRTEIQEDQSLRELLSETNTPK